MLEPSSVLPGGGGAASLAPPARAALALGRTLCGAPKVLGWWEKKGTGT